MPRVVVLGGGVGGLTAAHELAERGFEVEVLELRRLAGGKARSIPVTRSHAGYDGAPPLRPLEDDAKGHEPWVPGEHGFRFFPGFYEHVIDTMSRIPSWDGRPVTDHLVSTTRVGITQYGKPSFEVPALFPRGPSDAVTVLEDLLVAFSPVTELTPDDLAFFGARIWQIMTSCQERRLEEYERLDWWDFIGAPERSLAYQKFLASGITRSLVAAKARTASTRTMGDIFIQLVLTILSPVAGSTDRLLDGPTNRVWVHPWRMLVEALGVRYRFQHEVLGLRLREGRIAGVEVRAGGRTELVTGDFYVSALPVERFAPLLTQELLAQAPALASLVPLAGNVEWMNGIQYYLTHDVPMVHGHVIHIDTEWALTSVSQAQFWRGLTPRDFADGSVHGILSVDVSDRETPGGNGRAARECTRDEVAREVWEQLERSVNAGGDPILRDEDLRGWFLDPDIQPDPARPGSLRNSEPLLVNLIDTWRLRPEATTGIENLFLASDYVRTYTDLATMKGANEAARRAVNGLLDAAGSSAPRCAIWPLHEPELLAPFRAYDAVRFRAGQPWDPTLVRMAAAAMAGAAPIIAAVRPLLSEAGGYGATPLAGARTVTDQPGAQALEQSTLDLGGPTDFVARLGWYRDAALDTLLSAVPTKEPSRYLYAPIADYVARSGRGLRPALTIATARAHGAPTRAALPSAAGIEMLHDAFLVHDDIEDGSDERRGQATLHRRIGLPLSINVGDAMQALSMRLFAQNVERLGPHAAVRIFVEVDRMLFETLEGQALELGWLREHALNVGVDDYLRLVLKKTAYYSFIQPMRIGALVADPDDAELDRFDRYGFLLGAAFQIRDDVLNLVGGSQYGKELGGDLYEGKRTLVLAHALAHASPSEHAWLAKLLARPRERRLPREILEVHELLQRRGSIACAAQAAEALLAAARLELPNALHSPRAPRRRRESYAQRERDHARGPPRRRRRGARRARRPS